MVSVIVPNYNHAPFLKQRLESIFNQTFTDFDVTILDDCSTDNGKEIIEGYRQHPKVNNIIFNDQNTGSTFKQWQKGIESVSGEWIWIAESDDWCEPIFLETLMRGVEQNTTLAIAQSLVVGDDGKILWNSKADFFEKNYKGIDFVREKMVRDNYGIPNASMCIFRRSAFLESDKDFTKYKFCGDWLFYISIALQGDVFISAKVLNYFRKHDKDVSGGAYKNGLSYSEFFPLLDSLVKRNIITDKEKNDALVFKFGELLKDDRLDENVRADLKKQFKTMINSKFYSTTLRHNTISFLRKHF